MHYNGAVDLAEIEHEIARLDALYRPVHRADLGPIDPGDFEVLFTLIQEQLAQLDLDDEAEAVLRAVVALYAAGDSSTRASLRELFDRYTSFRWGARLPRDWHTADDFR